MSSLSILLLNNKGNINYLGNLLRKNYDSLDKFYDKYEDKIIPQRRFRDYNSKIKNYSKIEIKKNHKIYLSSCEKKSQINSKNLSRSFIL